MVGQNVQARQTEIKIAEDLELDRKSEMQLEAVLQHLENQNEIMLQILTKLNIEKQ